MKRQRGLSLGLFIVACFFLVLFSIVGFKLFTPYMEYLKIEKAFKAVAANPDLKTATKKEIEAAYVRYAVIDNLSSVTTDDIDIEKDGGDILITASYSVRVPLVANINLLLDFTPSSAAK